MVRDDIFLLAKAGSWFSRQKLNRIFSLAFGLLQSIIYVTQQNFMTLTCFDSYNLWSPI